MRLRTRGDTRPGLRAGDSPRLRPWSSRPQHLSGRNVDREKLCELIERVAGIKDADGLTREQVQDVYDKLERLITKNNQQAA